MKKEFSAGDSAKSTILKIYGIFSVSMFLLYHEAIRFVNTKSIEIRRRPGDPGGVLKVLLNKQLKKQAQRTH